MKMLPLEYFRSCQLAYALCPKNLFCNWHLLTLAPFQILAAAKLLSTHMLTTHIPTGVLGSCVGLQACGAGAKHQAPTSSPVGRETLFSWTGNLPWGCSCKLAPLSPHQDLFPCGPRLLQPPGLPGVLLSRWGHSYSGNYLRHLHIKAFNNNMPSHAFLFLTDLLEDPKGSISSVQWLVLVGSVPPSSKEFYIR